MSKLQQLLSQREELLREIRTIEESCEEIENENNARRMKELNLEKTRLTTQRSEIQKKISEVQENLSSIDKEMPSFLGMGVAGIFFREFENENNNKRLEKLNKKKIWLLTQQSENRKKISEIEKRLSLVNNEMARMSETGTDRILEAIDKQRWYYFKNKPHIMFDKSTGLLWSNPAMVPFVKSDNTYFSIEEATRIAREFDGDGFKNWKIVTRAEFEKISYPGTDYPYYIGNNRRIYKNGKIIMDWNNYENYTNIGIWWMDSAWGRSAKDNGVFLIFTRDLVKDSEYENIVSANNFDYTKNEKLQFTLDLFVQNDLWPIFDNEEITKLYRKKYDEKPKLQKRLQELQPEIEKLQIRVRPSFTSDYQILMEKYDIDAIGRSVIRYYEAVQNWTEELIEKLDHYEQEKRDVIREFYVSGLKLSREYEPNHLLTQEENTLLARRQRSFARCFSLGMNTVRSKLLSVKHQAEDLEYRMDEIDNGDDAIRQLALLEKEERASFSLVAENTAKLVRNALKKIEFFEANRQFVLWAIKGWERWTESFVLFKTTCREEMKVLWEKDGIEEGIWQNWYSQWQSLRFSIEEKVQPVMEREFRGRIGMIQEDEISVAQQLISELELYRNNIDRFFREERKGIYESFVSQTQGALLDKLESEKRLYQITTEFLNTLENIAFNCASVEDRMFILRWSGSLLDIRMDTIFSFAAGDNLRHIVESTLAEFSQDLKKGDDICTVDKETYHREQKEKAKLYYTLVFNIGESLK